jgi:hypothetical protein
VTDWARCFGPEAAYHKEPTEEEICLPCGQVWKRKRKTPEIYNPFSFFFFSFIVVLCEG